MLESTRKRLEHHVEHSHSDEDENDDVDGTCNVRQTEITRRSMIATNEITRRSTIATNEITRRSTTAMSMKLIRPTTFVRTASQHNRRLQLMATK